MTGKAENRGWTVYLLLCAGGRTYAGMAKDVRERFEKHRSGKGAKFTRANPPQAILGASFHASKSEALKAEYRLKKLAREKRLAWAKAHPWSTD